MSGGARRRWRGLLGFPPALALPARDFLHGVAPALPALSLFYACRGLSEGLALPRPTMIFGVLGLLLLIPLGYALMYGAAGLPALGALGCGIATSLVCWAQVAGFAAFLLLSRRYRGAWLARGRHGGPIRRPLPACCASGCRWRPACCWRAACSAAPGWPSARSAPPPWRAIRWR